MALAPLVESIHNRWDEIAISPRDDLNSQIPELVLAWLRRLVAAKCPHNSLRAQMRDTLLAGSNRRDAFVIEALALLGPDLDDRAQDHLRHLAKTEPESLAPAVESELASRSLAQRNSSLLAALTEAYYIKLPSGDDPWGLDNSLLGAVRCHERVGTGIYDPPVAWHYGPFWNLLQHDAPAGMRTINRILDHGARASASSDAYETSTEESDVDSPSAIELELHGVGARRCLGDATVWAWYRSAAPGASPCVSALLAVERWADQMIAREVSLRGLARTSLFDCHNLAMPGLVAGIFVRHLELVTDELDAWLPIPELWHLEFSRAHGEQYSFVRRQPDKGVHGQERRAHSFRDVAGLLMVNAIARNDRERITALRGCGAALMQNARCLVAEVHPEDDTHDLEHEYLIKVASWSALLDPGHYRRILLPDGTSSIEYQPPDHVVNALRPVNEEIRRGQEAYRLLSAYSGLTSVEDGAESEGRNTLSPTIHDDLALAREFLDRPSDYGPPYPEDVAAASAASAVLAHQQGIAHFAEDELQWAAELLVSCANSQRVTEFVGSGSWDPERADRSAAAALPALFLLAAHDPSRCLPSERIEAALLASAASPFDEVRRNFAAALGKVWDAECAPNPNDATCIHEIAFRATEATILDSRLRPSITGGSREPNPSGSLAEHLDGVDTQLPSISQLVMSIIAAGGGAASTCCVAYKARQLLEVLLRAHCRAVTVMSEQHPSSEGHPNDVLVVKLLLSHAARGDMRPLLGHVKAYLSHPKPLRKLLDELSQLATYDSELRLALPSIWPPIMSEVLDAVDAGTNLVGDQYSPLATVASMLPQPTPRLLDPEPGTSLHIASSSWIHPDRLSELVLRWIPVGRGSPECVDAAVCLIRTAEPAWQAAVGLNWVNELVDGAFETIAKRSYNLPEWLGELRTGGCLDAAGRALVQRLIDGLAASGDNRCLALQFIDEQKSL